MIANKLKLAEKNARYSNVKRAKVSAISFTASGQVIAKAHNRRIGVKNQKFTEHAEECLIQKLNKLKAFDRFENIYILVVRVIKVSLAIAKPCKKCKSLLEKYPVTILYTDFDGSIKECK